MDSKDVEEIFKGVLTDESQESQESVFPLAAVGTATSTPVHTSVPHNAGMVSPSGSVAHPGSCVNCSMCDICVCPLSKMLCAPLVVSASTFPVWLLKEDITLIYWHFSKGL